MGKKIKLEMRKKSPAPWLKARIDRCVWEMYEMVWNHYTAWRNHISNLNTNLSETQWHQSLQGVSYFYEQKLLTPPPQKKYIYINMYIYNKQKSFFSWKIQPIYFNKYDFFKLWDTLIHGWWGGGGLMLV